jgi:hypothetical protein
MKQVDLINVRSFMAKKVGVINGNVNRHKPSYNYKEPPIKEVFLLNNDYWHLIDAQLLKSLAYLLL